MNKDFENVEHNQEDCLTLKTYCMKFNLVKEEKKRILIIDDDLDILMLLERMFLKENYSIETAASLHEAEDIIRYFKPHLILLDINVNGEDGRQLCWKLKKNNSACTSKVIIMSGFDFSISRALLFGADDLIPKPLNTEYLLHQTRMMTNQHQIN